MRTAETARYYDLFHDPQTADVEFYVGLAVEEGGPVCELGAGTGRVAVPIARAGVEITGVDLSVPMLERFEARVAREPEAVRRRVSVAQGDMRSWGTDQAFQQVFLPFRVFLVHLTAADRHRALENCWRLLAPGGRLALNVFHPSAAYMRLFSGEAEGSWRDVGMRALPEGGRLHLAHTARYDTLNKRLEARFRWTENDRVTEEAFELGYVYRDELVLHLERAHFAVEQLWGDFARNPLEHEGQEMVVVARKVD
jgi:SAM-dependent methyltransferase